MRCIMGLQSKSFDFLEAGSRLQISLHSIKYAQQQSATTPRSLGPDAAVIHSRDAARRLFFFPAPPC